MEETLDYENIVAFRSAYRLTHHKKRKSKGKTQITAKTTKKIIKDIRINPVHIVTKLIGMISLNFSGELVKIALKRNNGQKHVAVKFKNSHFMIEKKFNYFLIQAVASCVCVKYKREKEIVVFRSLDNDQLEMKADVRIPFHSYSNWYVSIDSLYNNYLIYLKGFLQLLTDFELIQFLTPKVNKFKIHSSNIELNTNVIYSEVKIIGSKKNRSIRIKFDKFRFLTDPKTFEKRMKLNNSLLSLIMDRGVKISSDFSLSETLNRNKMSLLIPLFKCCVPINYFVVNEDFITLFLQYQAFFRDTLFPKIDIDFVLDMEGLDIDMKLPNSYENQNLQIRKISFTFKDSIFKFMLSSAQIPNLFTLYNLNAYYNEQLIDLKIAHFWVKILDLIKLIPKDAYQIFLKTSSYSSNENDNNTVSASDDSSDSDKNNIEISFNKSADVPLIKYRTLIDYCDIDLSLNEMEKIDINILDVKESFDDNKLNVSALFNHVTFNEHIISHRVFFFFFSIRNNC